MSKTLSDRLERVRRRLYAIDGTVRLLQLDELQRPASDEDIIATILDDVAECQTELTWLHNLPPTALTAPAPTDDEREAERRRAKQPSIVGGAR